MLVFLTLYMSSSFEVMHCKHHNQSTEAYGPLVFFFFFVPAITAIFKIAILGLETWNLEKGPEVADGLSFYPRGSEMSLFLLYRQRFPRYGPIFKIAIFGLETWNLKKVVEVAYGPSFYPRGSKLSLFSLYGQRFPSYSYSSASFVQIPGFMPKYGKFENQPLSQK